MPVRGKTRASAGLGQARGLAANNRDEVDSAAILFRTKRDFSAVWRERGIVRVYVVVCQWYRTPPRSQLLNPDIEIAKGSLIGSVCNEFSVGGNRRVGG